LYANCLLIYENAGHREQDIYLPKCLCIISKYPFFETFKQVLSFLYSTYISNGLDESESIERILDNFMFEVPMTSSPTAQVLFKVGSEVQKLAINPFLLDYPLDPLFLLLTPDNIIKILGWVCTERTIIFVSENAYLLSLIIQSFLWILQPLKWCHACIGILPPDFEYLLECPQPLLIGVCGTDLKTTFGKGDDVVAVYLDDNKIVTTLSKDRFPIPGKLAGVIKKNMRDLAGKKVLNISKEAIRKLGSAFHYRTTSDRGYNELLSIAPIKRFNATLDPLKVKECFMPFIKELLGNYDKYLEEVEDTEEPKEQGKVFKQLTFNYKTYFTERDDKNSMFFEKFSKTQLFEQYGEEYDNFNASEQYLIEIVNKFQEGKQMVVQKESLIQESVTAIDPDYRIGKKSMLIKHVLNKCETFPSKLNNSLFLNMQAISWNYIHNTEKQNPLHLLTPIECLLHLSFAKNFVDYFHKNEAKLKKFWQIVKTHKSSQCCSGSKSYSSRNNNKTRSININACAGVIDTSSTCLHCNHIHSLWDIRKRMYNNKELYITCTKCSKTFIPHFSIQKKYHSKKHRQTLQQEYLNPSILLAVIEETQKSPGSSMDNSYFYEHCPVIFWNLLILFSDIRLELSHSSSNEVNVCTIYDYMNREEEDQDSGDLSEPELASRSKAQGKLKRGPQFNVKTFLTVHTNAQKTKGVSQGGSIKRGNRTLAGAKVINIDLSRKAVRMMSQAVFNTPSLAKSPSIDMKLVCDSEQEGVIGKNLQDFTTKRIQIQKPLVNETKCSTLIGNAMKSWSSDNQKKAFNIKSTVNLYEKFINDRLQALKAEKMDRRNELKVAQEFLSRILKLLLVKVSVANDNNLMEVQSYIINNKLLEN